MTTKVLSVADLSVDELKIVIQETVTTAIRDLLDPDILSEPPFAPDIAARLHRYQQEKPIGIPVEQVIKNLGLDD